MPGRNKGGSSGGGQGSSAPGGRGQMGGFGSGPGGFCVCNNCGHKQVHQQGQPCTQVSCPKCGALMTRER